MQKVVLGVLMLIIGLLMISGILPDVIDMTVSEDYDENFSVNTGVGETSAICTLTYDNYYGDLTDMSVSSTSSSDTAAITDYNDTNKQTTVSGLAASTSRILTIGYARERQNEAFTYFNSFVMAIPFILCVALIWSAIKPLFGK